MEARKRMDENDIEGKTGLVVPMRTYRIRTVEAFAQTLQPIRPRTDASKQARAAIMQQVERLSEEDRWTLAVDLAGRWPRAFALPAPGEVAGS